MHPLLYETNQDEIQSKCAVELQSVHILKMLSDAFLFIGVPESAVPERQCLWCARVLWKVQWTWGECKVPISSICCVKLWAITCVAV